MPTNKTPTQLTADGLIILRANEALMATVGASDPFASWFITEDGRRLAALATETDPVFTAFNLARYRWFGEHLQAAANRFPQVVILGAGYDTRPWRLSGFDAGNCQVFEVDVATTLSAKRQVLEDHGVQLPRWITQIPSNLNVDNVSRALQEGGFHSDLPSFVMAEGLFYYLNMETLLKLVSPAGLGLAAGSVFLFDFWNDARVSRLNERVFERRGMRLFKSFPLPQEAEPLTAALSGRGFKNIEVTPLDVVARRYWPPPHSWTEGDGWLLCKSEVASA